MKQGELKSIFNKKKKFGENRFYNISYLRRINEEEPKPFLFTDDQLKDASDRASKNKEDLEKCTNSKRSDLDIFVSGAVLFLLGFALGLTIHFLFLS